YRSIIIAFHMPSLFSYKHLPPTQLYTLSLHDALPISTKEQADAFNELQRLSASPECAVRYFETVSNFDVRNLLPLVKAPTLVMRSEEHTSELQSRFDLVCRLLLEKKKD